MKASSELVQGRRAWGAFIRDAVSSIGDAATSTSKYGPSNLSICLTQRGIQQAEEEDNKERRSPYPGIGVVVVKVGG